MFIFSEFLHAQARQRVIGMLTEMIKERRSSLSPGSCEDMLDCLLQTDDDDSKVKLTDDQILDLIIALIYSGYETVSTTSMMAVKYLHDHPKALEELRVRILLDIHTFLSGFAADQLAIGCRANIWRSDEGSHLRMNLAGVTTSL